MDSYYTNDFYRSIIDNSIDGYFLIDENCAIVRYNLSFSRIFSEYNLADETLTLFDLVSGESRKNLRKKIHYVRREKTSATEEIELVQNGTRKYCLISLNPIDVPQLQGIKASVYGFVKDITEIQILQNQLREERNYNRGIIENVNFGFVFVNDDNEYLDYNNEYLRMLGREKSDLSGRTFYDFTASMYVEEQKRLVAEMQKSGRPFIFEKEFIRKDGSRMPVLVSMSRLYSDSGKPLGNFAFIRDITEQKKIEGELIAYNRKILNFIDIYTTISAGFLQCVEIQDVYSVLHEAIKSLLNPDSVEVLSKRQKGFISSYAYNPVSRGDRYEVDGRLSLIISKTVAKKSPILVRDTKTELNDEDVAVFPSIVRYKSAIFIPLNIQGDITSLIILSFERMISEIDSVLFNILAGISNLASITIEKIVSLGEQALMRSTFDRYERLTAMGRIIAGVAHEINNPLSIMQFDVDDLKTFCESNAHTTFVDGAFRETIQSIQEEISRLSGIVKQLKDYSKPSHIEPDDVNVDDLIKTIPIKIYLKKLQKKGVRITLALRVAKSCIRIPKNRFIQVLMNFIANAEDAISDTKQGEIVIETGFIEKDKKSVFISIRDNGIGIPEDSLQTIFEPFFTSKKAEGTGLGLSISYSIIKSYGGEIIVKSVEGKGAEFIIIFPVV